MAPFAEYHKILLATFQISGINITGGKYNVKFCHGPGGRTAFMQA
jgi:hypothetical protein